MHNPDEMKRKNEKPATQGDFERFEAKLNLERFATKDEFSKLTAVVHRLSVKIVAVEASVGELREDMLSAFKGLESRLVGRMDAFMSNTMRVDRDNILLNHRLNEVEGRASSLERRSA